MKYLLLWPFRWFLIATIVGVCAGTASAALLASLDWVTHFRDVHLWLIALLPLGGFGIGLLYHHYGRSVEAGNNLILEEIHKEVDSPKNMIPLRMTPMVLLGTVATHFFGGSAGREGTAIQMGASLADQFHGAFKLESQDRKILLMAGVSAGFGSVFGTPLAGAVFGLEVLSFRRANPSALFPCLIAALVGDFVTRAWRIHHTLYVVSSFPSLSFLGVGAAIAAGACFGLTGMAFSRANHWLSAALKKRIPYSPLRLFSGGLVVALLVWAVGNTRYIGLGIPTIVDSFSTRLAPWDFFGKFVFTTLTLGSGFKGGEVTPLFFIGATLGNALSYILPLPTSLLAGMGFVGVFAGAANTPIASTVMAVELFGSSAVPYVAIACGVSFLCSGRVGIYHRPHKHLHRK